MAQGRREPTSPAVCSPQPNPIHRIASGPPPEFPHFPRLYYSTRAFLETNPVVSSYPSKSFPSQSGQPLPLQRRKLIIPPLLPAPLCTMRCDVIVFSFFSRESGGVIHVCVYFFVVARNENLCSHGVPVSVGSVFFHRGLLALRLRVHPQHACGCRLARRYAVCRVARRCAVCVITRALLTGCRAFPRVCPVVRGVGLLISSFFTAAEASLRNEPFYLHGRVSGTFFRLPVEWFCSNLYPPSPYQ